ncbi:MAG: copper amine oxidase N-terminal domain-containing protein, partial [Bacillota bacterium]|nr:copper amine oxidase N-terminal domain-containing protein [Bacillota bacterium]
VTGATHYALVLKDGEVLSDKMSVPTTPDWILGIDIRYNGKYVDCDAAPYIKNDRTMVPVRAIAEAMGATVNYDDATKTATIIKGGSKIEIKMYSSAAYVNGVAYTLDAPAETVNDRIFVPVRFISEGFGCNVNWDANTKSVIIK